MEYGREGGQGVRAGLHHLAHDVDPDGAGVAQRHADLVLLVAVDLAQLFFQETARLFHRQAAQVGGAKLLEVDGAVRRDGLPDGVLASTPDVYHHLVTGAKAVVGRSGKVVVGLEGQVARVEDVAPEHLLFPGQFLRGGLLVQHRRSLVLRLFTQARLVLVGTTHRGSGRAALTFIQFLHAEGLLLRHAAAGQLGRYLFLFLALLDAFLHVLQHLLVAHRLGNSTAAPATQQQHDRDD